MSIIGVPTWAKVWGRSSSSKSCAFHVISRNAESNAQRPWLMFSRVPRSSLV